MAPDTPIPENAATMAPGAAAPAPEAVGEHSSADSGPGPLGSVAGDPPDAPDPEAPWGRRADGTPRNKPGRPPKTAHLTATAKVAPPRKPPPPPPAPQAKALTPETPLPEVAKVPADPLKLAEISAGLWFNIPASVLGDEWLPDTAKSEHLHVRDAFRDFYASKGVTELSPELQLGLVLGGYTIARLSKPTMVDRMKRGIEWLRAKIRRNR